MEEKHGLSEEKRLRQAAKRVREGKTKRATGLRGNFKEPAGSHFTYKPEYTEALGEHHPHRLRGRAKELFELILSHCETPVERGIVCLTFVWHFDGAELAAIFGVHYNRIAAVLPRIKNRIPPRRLSELE